MNKKIVFLVMMFLSLSVGAQDVATIMRNHEDKIYSPKYKGLTDLVVDMESPSLTKQLNEQMIFGNIRDLRFRFYWTATPERVAVEILGMPEGFNEIKQQLKQAMLSRFESIIPLSLEKKFVGYKFSLDPKDPASVIAKDEKALNVIPEYKLTFGTTGLLSTLNGKKTIGTMTTSFDWEKMPWSEPRLVNKKSIVKSVDGPQSVTIESVVDWQVISTIGLPTKSKTLTKQIITIPGSKPQENSVEDEVNYRNYKVNVGEALKWFLSNGAN